MTGAQGWAQMVVSSETSRNRDWTEQPTGAGWSELQLRLIPRGKDGVGRGRGAKKFRVCSAHLPAAAVTEDGGGGGEHDSAGRCARARVRMRAAWVWIVKDGGRPCLWD